jgi:hypothetical protein
MRAGRRGVFVSNIAVTHGSEKKQKKIFYGKCGLSFLFRTGGRDGGRQMPTVYDVQTTTRKELEREQKGKTGLKVLYSGLELAMENSTQHHNTE